MSKSEMDTVGVDTTVASTSTSVYPDKISFASESIADELPDRYLEDNRTPLSWKEASERYRNHRLGEDASAKENGFQGGLRPRALKKNGVIHKADRNFRAEFSEPIVGLVTIFGSYSPVDPVYGPILDYEVALTEAINKTTQTIRYRLRQHQSAEYALIEAGTGTNGVPHWHLLVWVDGSDDIEFRTDLEAIVSRVQSGLPPDLREFQSETEAVPTDAVLVDQSPNEKLETFPADPDEEPVHAMARYVANQLPHLGRADRDLNDFNGMSEAEAQFGAVADASSTRGYRTSSGVPPIE